VGAALPAEAPRPHGVEENDRNGRQEYLQIIKEAAAREGRP
jgi:hypothetical protein